MEKSLDILLVESPPWDAGTAPLGLAYLATYLKSKGVAVEVFDLNIAMYSIENNIRKKGWGNSDFHWWQSDKLKERYSELLEYFIDKILSFGSSAIGFSVVLPSIPFLNMLTRRIKSRFPEKIIIVGGPGSFFLSNRMKDFDRSKIDYFVVGDGEVALYELIKGLNEEGKLTLESHSRCRLWRESASDEALCVQSPRISDLDSIPFPTFEEFDLFSYREGSYTLPILFSKGCTRRCTFCSDRVLSYPYRYRKSKCVVEEMKEHLKRYNSINTFRVNDLSMNANLKFINELCDRIIGEGLAVSWYGQAQVRPDMSNELLLKMKKSGLRQFDLGLESFSDNVLRLMRKGYSSADAVNFLKRCKDAGIETNILLIVGYPGESEDDFISTLENIRKNVVVIDRIGSLNICGNPVGSELNLYPAANNIIPHLDGDWATPDLSNTYKIRKRRYEDVIKLCNELNIRVEPCLELDVFEEVKNQKD